MRDLLIRLRRSGWRLKAQRRVVAEVLDRDHVHLTAQEVHSRAVERLPEISRASVYNIDHDRSAIAPRGPHACRLGHCRRIPERQFARDLGLYGATVPLDPDAVEDPSEMTMLTVPKRMLVLHPSRTTQLEIFTFRAAQPAPHDRGNIALHKQTVADAHADVRWRAPELVAARPSTPSCCGRRGTSTRPSPGRGGGPRDP